MHKITDYSTNKMFSDIRCDFKRYSEHCGYHGSLTFWEIINILMKSPAFFAILVYRFGFWCNYKILHKNNKIIRYPLNFIYYIGLYLSVILFKIDIDGSSEIGEGLFLSNNGNIIMGVKKMGKGCTIQHNVTIGLGIENEPPEIGNYLYVGSNSIIYGKIKIGHNVKLNPSTVLTKNIPGRCEISGNPARILSRDIV